VSWGWVSFFYQGGAIFLTLCRRYTEAILENGALIVENMKVLKPLSSMDTALFPVTLV
jgi:hypothetical protein